MESNQDPPSRRDEESAPPPGNLQALAGVPGLSRESRVWDATRRAIEAAGYQIDELTPAKGGASAVVLKGREGGTKRDVALKVIVDPTSERSKKLLEREAKMLTAEGLPAVVVRYYKKLEPTTQPHQPVLVLEWIDGESLGEFLRRSQLSVQRRLELTRELFERLAELHESGWFWRDLSPNNILVERKTSRLRFIDFGLAKLQADRQASIHTLGPGGTPYFTRDAILAGEIQATVQDDVRAAAMMALRVLGVENAKTKTAEGEALRERRDLVRELRSHQVPLEFGERVVDVLIAAEHRPESTPAAKEVAERLETWFEERVQRRRRLGQLKFLGALAAFLAVLLVFGWQLYRKEVRSSRLAGVEVLEQELSRRPNLNHPSVQSLLLRARELQARLQSAGGGQLDAGDDQTLTELLAVQRQALAASHDLEAAEPLLRSLGEVLVHTPWEPGATQIDQRRKQAEERLLELGRQFDEGRFDGAWAGLRTLQRQLAQLAADNAVAVRAVGARTDFRRLERGVTDRLRALPQYAPIAARVADAERLLVEGRYDDSRGPGAATEFAQAKSQLEAFLVQQETVEERRQRLTQDETTIATLENRILVLEAERGENQTRLEQFQSLLSRAEAERASLESSRESLSADLATSRTRAKELEARIQATESSLATARAEHSKAAEHGRRLEVDLATTRTEVEGLRQQIAAAATLQVPRDCEALGTFKDASTGLAQRIRHKPTGIEFALIPSGEFWMGSLDADELASADEKPRRRVLMESPVYMAVHEVTVGQWRSFAEAARYRTEAERGDGGYTLVDEGGFWSHKWIWSKQRGATWKNPLPAFGFEPGLNHPVTQVSWNDAMAYCLHYGFTLPTDRQWERACRAGTDTRFYWGDDRAGGQGRLNAAGADRMPKSLAFSQTFPFADGYLFTSPVGSLAPNGYGLFDMLGNVWEWTSTPVGSGPQRVIRGGSWYDSPADCRSANRYANGPSVAGANLGFRPVLAPRSEGGAR